MNNSDIPDGDGSKESDDAQDFSVAVDVGIGLVGVVALILATIWQYDKYGATSWWFLIPAALTPVTTAAMFLVYREARRLHPDSATGVLTVMLLCLGTAVGFAMWNSLWLETGPH